jgi:protein-tyrosine-phosphatase
MVIHMSKRILFVCTGNMDRSPTAEDLLKGREDFEAMSA